MKKSIEYLKNHRYNVNYMDGSYDAQNSGMTIFENLESAQKKYNKISLNLTGKWSRLGDGQPQIFKELCKLVNVGKKELVYLEEALDEQDQNAIINCLNNIHFVFAEPIEKEEWFWKNKWDHDGLDISDYESTDSLNRTFDTLAFDEECINIDNLKAFIKEGQISRLEKNHIGPPLNK